MDAHRCAEEAIPLYLGEQEGKRGRAEFSTIRNHKDSNYIILHYILAHHVILYYIKWY